MSTDRHKPQTQKSQVTLGAAPSGALQRKCACGQHTIAGGECESCSKKRLQRHASGQAETEEAPPVVHEVLRSPGQPLDAETRGFMESRFHQDFSRVRLHTDARAAESSAALRAHAYTMGQEIVFGAGQYAPGSARGKRLLAHELVHTIQQGGNGVGVATKLIAGRADDVSEREADAIADSVMLSAEHATVPLAVKRSEPAVLQRQETREEEARQDTESRIGQMFTEEPESTPKKVLAPPKNPICGPNVTAQVIAAILNVRNAFNGWNFFKKGMACQGLTDLVTATVAWDINELHDQDWIHSYYGPDCATAGAKPSCFASVQIIKDCHYAGSVNYVIFGTMCKLCHDHYKSWLDPKFLQYSKPMMINLIDIYKGGHSPMQAEPSANFEESKAWASAGYDGWPTGGSPPKGDRPNCKPVCGEPYDGPRFTIRWFPFQI